MKKIFYIILFIITFIIITPKTYAYTNMSTYYNVTMPDYETNYKSKTCGNTTLYDFINRFISSVNWSSSTYQIFISDSTMYFVQTDYVNQSQGHKIWVKGTYSNYSYTFGYTASKSSYPAGSYVFYFQNNCQESDLDRVFNYLKGIAETGSFDPNFQNNLSIGIYSSGSSFYNFVESINSINNNSSYNVNLWWYYSSYDLYMANSSEAQGNNNYWKTIHINDNNIDYGLEAQLPSYYDLYPPVEEPQIIGYRESLNTFYTNLSSSDLSSYNLKIKFNIPQSLLGFYQTPQEYLDNTTFDYYCSGRVDNTDYYSYESFPCSLTKSYILTDSSIEYTFSNVSTSSIISNYDKIFVTIKTNYIDSNVSTTIFNLSYTYNLGNFFNTSYKGVIYETFSSLPLNFKTYFSSNNSLNDSTLYIKKYNFINYNIKYIGFSNTSSQQNLVIGQSILGTQIEETDFISTEVSNSIDTGIMIYQDNGLIMLPKLELFFNNGMIISFNNSSNSNDFYYIDNTGTIQTGNFVKPIVVKDDDYDINYYINIVNSFINDLESDTLELSVLTQSFYNGLPLIFQSFIFVLFILACIYFTYLLIKRK